MNDEPKLSYDVYGVLAIARLNILANAQLF